MPDTMDFWIFARWKLQNALFYTRDHFSSPLRFFCLRWNREKRNFFTFASYEQGRKVILYRKSPIWTPFQLQKCDLRKKKPSANVFWVFRIQNNFVELNPSDPKKLASGFFFLASHFFSFQSRSKRYLPRTTSFKQQLFWTWNFNLTTKENCSFLKWSFPLDLYPSPITISC